MQAIANLLDQARWRLIEAEQSLEGRDQSWAFDKETTLIHDAAQRITAALKLLDEQKEETCEEETPSDKLPCDDHWHHENPNY